MLDITYGETKNSAIVTGLVESLKTANLDGDLYIGYPILGSIDGKIEVDALLVTAQSGLVALDLSSPTVRSLDEANASALKARQDDIYVSLENKLKAYANLRQGRSLRFEINVVSIQPEVTGLSEQDAHYISTPNGLIDTITNFSTIDDSVHQNLNAALQHTATMRPKKRRAEITDDNSKGAMMRHIEAAIANMDAWQKKAAIEFPEGPQRIRGLAGSGKTIVLAQKAAILHAKFPNWEIAVTFQTRSLYQQFRRLIERFYRELTLDEPDWSKLSILHAWGSASSGGLYYEVAKSMQHPVKDFGYAKAKYGYDRAFEGICQELLSDFSEDKTIKKYDAILIDEAQDFPQPFFEIVFHACNAPHRIVWAYDELQNLGDYSMPPAADLFGKKPDGTARVELSNLPDSPQQDIVLPICYRNTKWALTIAHGLGFGVYREKGLVQFFDAPELWDDIGYHFLQGKPRGGTDVAIERKANSSPEYFQQHVEPTEAVTFQHFTTTSQQYQEVAKSIAENIEKDELDPDDIMVVFCSPMTIRSESAAMMRALANVGIDSHVPGVTSSRDEMFQQKAVALTGIYRAKGNEAPIVYVVNADHCFEGFELSKRRNILFTAITRSRAWIRIAGVGNGMEQLITEANKIITNDYRLKFQYPSKAEIAKIKKFHRDMPESEKQALDNDLEGMMRLIKRIDEGEIDPNSLPEDVRKVLSTLPKAV